MPKIIKYTILQNVNLYDLECEVTDHLDAWKLHGPLVISQFSERVKDVSHTYPIYCQAMILEGED